MATRQPRCSTLTKVAQATETSHSTFSYSLWIVLSLGAVMLILDMSNYITMAPETAILENIACSKHYNRLEHVSPSDSFKSERCKIEPIESEVALINGWKDVLETIPGILCTLSYGALAARMGRKKVLLLRSWDASSVTPGLGWFGSWFPHTVPLPAIWFSGLWEVLGGGATTMNSMLFVMVADINAALLVPEFLSVPIGAALMSINPWILYLGASAIFSVGIYLTVFLIPETFPSQKRKHNQTVRLMKRLFLETDKLKQNGAVLLILSSFFVAQLGKQGVGVRLSTASPSSQD